MSALLTAEPRFRRLIDATAAYVGLPVWSYRGRSVTPGELLEGLILAESSGNPQAKRYERHQDDPSRWDLDTPQVDDGLREDDASYGLMQVMGTTYRGLVALDRPARLDYAILFRPLIGIAMGLEVFLQELAAMRRAHRHEQEAEHIVRALSRYNGGHRGDEIDPATGDYRRRIYVDRVAVRCGQARTDRDARGWAETPAETGEAP